MGSSAKLSARGVCSVTRAWKHSSVHRPFISQTRNASTIHYENDMKFREFEEIKIPTPFGHISGVWWGPRDKQPILAMHGWQDNAFTFRPLMELLPQDLSVLAMDFPGHGLSSRYPNGVFYHSPDNLINIRRVVKHFGWEKVSLMGHSMGAISAFTYAACYPQEINFTIQLDNIKPITTRRPNVIEYIAKSIDDLLEIDARNVSGSEPPSYDENELIERLYVGSSESISKEGCRVLLERGAVQSSKDPSKYYYTRDSRLKLGLTLGLSSEDVHMMALRMAFPMLAIKFLQGSYFEPKEEYLRVVQLLKSSNREFEFHTVHGTHHSHLNNAEIVAPIITNFLQKYHK